MSPSTSESGLDRCRRIGPAQRDERPGKLIFGESLKQLHLWRFRGLDETPIGELRGQVLPRMLRTTLELTRLSRIRVIR